MADDLIARIEAAEGPDRELDALIHCIAMPHCEMPSRNDRREGSGCVLFRGKEFRDAKPYTASIDAALTLVPDGWRPSIDCTFERPEVTLHPWDDHLLKHGRKHGKAATPALAILAASIRARAGR